MFNFLLLYNVIFILNVFLISAQVSDKRLCANEACSEIIALGKTILKYNAPYNDPRLISFELGKEVTIYSRPAGLNQKLCGVEIDGKRGYAPIMFIRESKVYTKDLKYTVDTELLPNVPSIDKNINTESPELSPHPTNSYEVVDSTTIYYNSAIEPSSTENPLEASVLSNPTNLNQQQTEPLNSHEKLDRIPFPENENFNAPGSTSDKIITRNFYKSEETKTEHGTKSNDDPRSVANENDPKIISEIVNTQSNGAKVDNSNFKDIEMQQSSETNENVLKDKDSVIASINNTPQEFQAEQAKVDSESLSSNKVPDFKSPGAQDSVTPSINNPPEEVQAQQANVDSESLLNSYSKDIEIQKSSDSVTAPINNPPENFQTEPAKVGGESLSSNKVSDFESPGTQDSVTPSINNPPEEFQAEQAKVDSEPLSSNKVPDFESPGTQDSVTPLINNPLEDFRPEPSAVSGVFSSMTNWLSSGSGGQDDDDADMEEDDDEVSVEEEGEDDENDEDELNFDEKLNLETPPLSTEENIKSMSTENILSETHVGKNEKESISETSRLATENLHIVKESEQFHQSEGQNIDNVEVKTTKPQLVVEPTVYDFLSDAFSESAIKETQNESDTHNSTEFKPIPDNVNYLKLEETLKVDELIKESPLIHQEVLPPQTTEKDLLIADKNLELPPPLPVIVKEQVSSNEDMQQKPNVSSEPSGTHHPMAENPTSENIETNSGDFANKMIENGNINENQLRESVVEESSGDEVETHKHDFGSLLSQQRVDKLSCSADPLLSECDIDNENYDNKNNKQFIVHFPIISYQILIVLVVTAVTVVVFLWGYMYIDKRGREGVLIGKINNIQKHYLIVQKENELLMDKLAEIECEYNEKTNAISNEMLLNMQDELEKEKDTRTTLEMQIQNLEKELENSTEVGLELNRMLTQFLSSENGSETLVANIEQLQRQIIEQQDTISAYNENLSMKETENHELRLEVDINNTKVTELQSELNKMALNLLKAEEDKELLQSNYETEIETIKEELEAKKNLIFKENHKFNEQVKDLKDQYEQTQRALELKSNEYTLLKENINQITKLDNNRDTLKSFLDLSAIQAELLQLRKEKQLLIEQLQGENNKCSMFEGKCQSALHDLQNFKLKYDEADRQKVEAITKLEVLDKYFKEREAQLQRELSKQESMWVEKQGEATSTIERIKYMQEELQNYKAQNESLKQEILEQEVQMKSQISVLEKKAHENWVAARQAERKVDDAKQEAAQLRNRLTLRERSLNEEKMHNRIQSPMEHNGEIPVSPAHISNDTAASPPLLFGGRDNLTISPPLPGMPFLPPPPGVPFMPPPLDGVPLPPPAFMPPPPSLIPGDHRPPPLGRISSPPLNSRYSPDRGYSPYSRNSPPTSDDDYDRMPLPPLYRGYNSYNRDDSRRELHRPPLLMNNSRNKGTGHSSGSANSNDSLDKLNRSNSKV